MSTDTTTNETPRRKPVKWGQLIGVLTLTVGLPIGIPAGIAIFNTWRKPFYDWSDRRAAWHARCDETVPLERREPTAACAHDLEQLMAEARAHGWTK
jgi:hypothetical protein